MSENNYRVTHIILNCFKTIIEERQYIYHLLFLPVLALTLGDLFISMLLSNDGFKNFGGILFFIYFIVNIYFYCCVCYRWLRYLILGEKTQRILDNYVPNRNLLQFSIEMIGLTLFITLFLLIIMQLAAILQPMASLIFLLIGLLIFVYFIMPLFIRLPIRAQNTVKSHSNELPYDLKDLLTLSYQERNKFAVLTMVYASAMFLFFMIFGIIIFQIFQIYDIEKAEDIFTIMQSNQHLTLQFILRLFSTMVSFISTIIFMRFLVTLYTIFQSYRS